MMENQNTFDMTENIPDEMFEIIGLEKDEEVPARPRIGYWADAWRRFKENKVALLAGIILLVLIFFIIYDYVNRRYMLCFCNVNFIFYIIKKRNRLDY